MGSRFQDMFSAKYQVCGMVGGDLPLSSDDIKPGKLRYVAGASGEVPGRPASAVEFTDRPDALCGPVDTVPLRILDRNPSGHSWHSYVSEADYDRVVAERDQALTEVKRLRTQIARVVAVYGIVVAPILEDQVPSNPSNPSSSINDGSEGKPAMPLRALRTGWAR
jgi:hypothetical protein